MRVVNGKLAQTSIQSRRRTGNINDFLTRRKLMRDPQRSLWPAAERKNAIEIINQTLPFSNFQLCLEKFEIGENGTEPIKHTRLRVIVW